MRGAFALREHSERDGTVRLELSGELDLAVAGRLESRLRELAEDRYRVQLDLSRLEFMDSSGIQAVIAALNNSRSDGWQLTINPQLTDRVRRVIEIAGITEYRWPDRD